MTRFSLTPLRALALSALFLLLWQGLAWGLPALGIHTAIESITLVGWIGLFLIGLGWSMWSLEKLAQRYERLRVERELAEQGDHVDDVLGSVGGETTRPRRLVWNPFDLAACYYLRGSQRLMQSMIALAVYIVGFVFLYFAVNSTSASAGVEPFDLPAGGGQEMMQQKVQIKKVVHKKFIINPLSNIKFSPPPIDNIDPQLAQESRNEYVVGQGSEDGALGQGDGKDGGYGAGTGKGKVRFARLRHSDRGWDRNFGVGGDNNILTEFLARSRMARSKVADKTEALDSDQLGKLDAKQAPPLLYVCGVARFSPSNSEKAALRQYLMERRGMILGDNLGGQGFHQQFVATMTELTGVTPVAIPRDDYIHRVPKAIPNLPIVVAHGGTVPLGWKIDGRWVVYYHPGALSDAWRDDHAGIRPEIYELCYQLGVNIMAYANKEKNQWLNSQK